LHRNISFQEINSHAVCLAREAAGAATHNQMKEQMQQCTPSAISQPLEMIAVQVIEQNGSF